jgi:hypothetical protein
MNCAAWRPRVYLTRFTKVKNSNQLPAVRPGELTSGLCGNTLAEQSLK